MASDSIVEQHKSALAKKELSAVELTSDYIAKIESKRDLNVFITVDKDGALAQAKDSDGWRAAGDARPLEGVPIAVKDNFCTEGLRTTAASRILENFTPTYESTVTRRLKEAGAVIVGKTNLDEFAMGSSTESSFFGATINPVGVELGIDNLSPGGSSGGSSAAMAANLAAATIGSDTGGSIRQPASFCGVWGFKPTYGVCSRWGIMAYASSLDQAGAFGASVTDVAHVMDVIAGEDAKDSTAIRGRTYAFKDACKASGGKLKVALPREMIAMGSTGEADRVWARTHELAKALDWEVTEVSMPNLQYALPAYYIIALCEASSNLARYDGVRYGHRTDDPKDIIDLYERSRAEGFGDETKRRIILGSFALSAGYYDAYYLRALKVRRKVAEDYAAVFEDADLILTPTAPTAAFALGAHKSDPVQMYLEDIFTVPINLAGLPAMSAPVAKNEKGLPLGLQLIGPRFADEKVISAAAAIETLLDGEA